LFIWLLLDASPIKRRSPAAGVVIEPYSLILPIL